MKPAFLGILGACAGASVGTVPDAVSDPDGEADADADADSDADTDPTSVPAPTSLTANCTATANILRYVCNVTVDPPQAVQISWVRDDGLGPERVHTSADPNAQHQLNVYFLAGRQPYTVVASAVAHPEGLQATVALSVGTPPPAVGDSALEVTGSSTIGLVGTEAPCDEGAWAVIYDTATGDLVWYHDLDPEGSLGMLDMVRFTDDQTIIGETDGQVVEVDVMGNDLTRFPVDYPGCCGLNHDIFEAGGLYYSQYQHIVGGLTLDNVVAIDASGEEQWQWDPADHLDIPPDANDDYLHTNSEYVDGDGNFYLSWLFRDAIGKFVGNRSSPDWGEPIWLMTGNGDPGDLGNDMTVDWSAIDGPQGFGGQHNLHLRHDGRLMVLDSNHGRALVLTVDEGTRTATVDAAYPTAEQRCGAQGTAMDTHAGNALVACLTDRVREYDLASSEILWEARIACRSGGGDGFTPNAATRWYPLDEWR